MCGDSGSPLTARVTRESNFTETTGADLSGPSSNRLSVEGPTPLSSTNAISNDGMFSGHGESDPPASSPGNERDPPSLWKQAYDRLPQASVIYPEGIAMPGGKFVLSLIKEVEQKKKECDNRRWFYNKDEKKVFIVDSLLSKLNKYAAIGDIMIQHNPDVLALVWGGFRGVLQFGMVYVEQLRLVSETVGDMVQLLCCCNIYETLYCQQTFGISKNLTASLLDLYESVLAFLCHTIQYLDRNTFGRIIKSFSTEMTNLKEQIECKKITVGGNVAIAEKEASSRSRLSQHAKMEQLQKILSNLQQPIDDIQNVTELIYTSIEQDKRMKIMEWLSTVQYEGHHILSQRRREEGTGLWILRSEAFVKWKESELNSILWLRAGAGFGKTILASSLIDSFEHLSNSEDHVVAYFYCNYKEPDRRDAASILRSIVKQFCVKKPDGKIPVLVADLYKKRESNAHANGPLSPDESTEMIINLSEKYQSTTVILDALDECDVETRKTLFSSLHKIIQKGSRVKMIVTSRYDDDINDAFSRGLSHYIVEKDNSADINLYIDSELDRRCNSDNLGSSDYDLLLKGNIDSELKELVKSTLQEKSNGMFMWVNLQITALCAAQTPGGVKEALERMPRTLNETYRQILERIQSQDKNCYRVALIILKWLLCAQEACSTSSVIQALAVKPRESTLDNDGLNWTIPRILGICKNLVVHDEALGTFRFAHFSVQEFLIREPEFEQNLCHIYMTEISLTTLLYHNGEPSPLPELYKYAMKHWVHHLRLSNSKDNTLLSLCMNLFRSPGAYKKWGQKICDIEMDLPNLGKLDWMTGLLWTICIYGLHVLYDSFLDSSGEALKTSNSFRQTPLIYAAMVGHEKVVQLLLQREDVDVNNEDNRKTTPLIWAAYCGHEKVVQLLLQREDVDVNIKDEEGRTPLNWAAYFGHEEVVQLLLQREDVDANIKDDYGKTPLQWAAERGYPQIVSLLKARIASVSPPQ